MDSELISMMNSIQDLYVKAGYSAFDVPCIAALFAVVGSQSSGKSSVLENIIGRDILPRGSGIVTRRPLIIQAKYDEKDERGEFAHAPGKIFRTPQEIMDEIDAETNRLLGDSVNVSDKPINLKYFSKGTADLTLIDLPGMVRYSVSGQADDVSDKIRNVILKYIGAPNCLILAVSAANSDLANSDALFLARSVDPDGRRTIGVLTKLDIMDKGTDALDVLNNEVVKLHHGWIGVVNRSQKDIKEKTQITQALQSEMEFFQNHESYKTISSRLGTVFLRKSLREKLLDHIKTLLPSMKANISKEYEQLQAKLLTYEQNSVVEKQPKVYAMKTVNKILRKINERLEGRSSEVRDDALEETANIKYFMNEKFSEALQVVSETEITDEKIRLVMRNLGSLQSNYSQIESTVNAIIKMELGLLLAPSVSCLNAINQEMISLLQSSSKVPEFPDLQLFFLKMLETVLANKFVECNEMINDIIEMQSTYIAYPDFNPMMEIVKGYQQIVPEETVNNFSTYDYIEAMKFESVTDEEVIKEGHFQTPVDGNVEEIYCRLFKKGIQYTDANGEEIFLNLTDYSISENLVELGGMTYTAVLMENEETLYLIHEDARVANDWCSTMTTLKKIAASSKTAASQSFNEEFIIRNSVKIYFNLVKKSVMDNIPKIISHYFINGFKSDIEDHIFTQLTNEKNESLQGLLKIDPRIVEEKNNVSKRIETLELVLSQLNKL